MLRFLTPFVSSLVLLISFWLFFKNQEGIWWLIGISIFTILLTGRILSRHYFFRFKLLWINLILVYVSQFVFLLILNSAQLRYTLAFIFVFIWGVLWWLLKKYFQEIQDIQTRDYLAVNKFLYYLGFWFLTTSLYSLIIFLHFPVLYALGIIILAIFLWSLEILRTREDLYWPYAVLAVFLVAQLAIAVYFLPVSFYVAGTIATLWFFFIIDNTANQLKKFNLYLGLFSLVVLILLITSII